MRKFLIPAVALFLLTASVGFLTSTEDPAAAYVKNGCKFSGSNPEIKYRFISPGSMDAAFTQAQAGWDVETPGWGGWFASTSTQGAENIPVEDYWTSAGWRGLATGGCASGGGQTWSNSRVEIDFNTRRTDLLGSTGKKNVAVHELGHALGLAHSSLGCSNPVIMRSDSQWALTNCGSSYAPYQNDLDGIDAIY